MSGTSIKVDSASGYYFKQYDSMPSGKPDTVPSASDLDYVASGQPYSATKRYLAVVRNDKLTGYYCVLDLNAYSNYSFVSIADVTSSGITIGTQTYKVGDTAPVNSTVFINPGTWNLVSSTTSPLKYVYGDTLSKVMMMATDSSGKIQQVKVFGVVYVFSNPKWLMWIILLIIIIVVVIVLGFGIKMLYHKKAATV